MDPCQQPQSQHFLRARMDKFEVQQGCVILSKDVYAPDQTGGGHEEAKPLFAANAREVAVRGDGTALSTMYDRDTRGGVLTVPLAPGIPIDEVGSIQLCHASKVPQKVPQSGITFGLGRATSRPSKRKHRT